MLIKSFKSYIGGDIVYNFVNSMIGKSKYCTDIMEKRFKKELIMSKNDDAVFQNSTKCWICDNVYVDGDFNVKDHCHITGYSPVIFPRPSP